MNRILALILFSSCVALHAQEVDDPEPVVDPPGIIEGYGQTKWGQSPAELQMVAPGAQLLKEKRGYTLYTVPGDGTITEIRYQFINNQLFHVRLTMDLREDKTAKADPAGLKLIQHTLAEKYFSDPGIVKLLTTANISIMSSEAENATAYVVYYNSTIRNQIEKAQADAQAAKEAEALAERAGDLDKLKALADRDAL
ncbi:MAG: hypothetical protein QGF67_19350 [Lentisphaeria bacterium]|jgi:hypothetical protein|nr:hypothetical protein [Lentisphaeria bacterium]MDP7743605.1 hypothetical protein [Lentisphaeria bacterium]